MKIFRLNAKTYLKLNKYKNNLIHNKGIEPSKDFEY